MSSWRVVTRSNQTGVRDVKLTNDPPEGGFWTPSRFNDATKAQADSIARALNSHAVLLNALQRIADYDADDGDALARIARTALAKVA
jgi:hypothetical protein